MHNIYENQDNKSHIDVVSVKKALRDVRAPKVEDITIIHCTVSSFFDLGISHVKDASTSMLCVRYKEPVDTCHHSVIKVSLGPLFG
jgi:hypothetical protein